MNICFISKYPPIEGGVSTQSYWLAHLLAKRGNRVYVVTNALSVEPEYRMWMEKADTCLLERDYDSGGSVRVVYATPLLGPHTRHIPAGHPTVTQLASLAVDTIRTHDCQVIVSWYFEPYGIAGSLASSWTGRPHILRHAGSDMFSLALDPELASAYREVIKTSAAFCAVGVNAASFGLQPTRAPGLPGTPLPDVFCPDGPGLDFTATAEWLRRAGCESILSATRPGTLVFGMYGKVGASKGTDDFLSAASLLRKRGIELQIAIMGGGTDWPRTEEMISDLGLLDVTWRFPPLAPWRVPGFIRACSATAYLERDFRISEHRAIPPFEVLACGGRLCASSESASKTIQLAAEDQRVLRAVRQVDPRDPAMLADALLESAELPPADHAVLRSWFASDDDIGRWYEDVFGTAVKETGGKNTPLTSTNRRDHAAEAAEIKALCPAATKLFGNDLIRSHALDAWRHGKADITQACFLALRELHGTRSWALPRDLLEDYAHADYLRLWGKAGIEGTEGVPLFSCPARLAIHDEQTAWTGGMRPVAISWKRIEWFSHDITAYIESDGRSEISDTPSCEVPVGYLFAKLGNLKRLAFRIDSRVAEVLRLCDGGLSVDEIAEKMAADSQMNSDGLRGLLARLAKTGILGARLEDGVIVVASGPGSDPAGLGSARTCGRP
jgi:glycosyltransferase involved in cell wall biosynthesis